ncbi:NucA/NucB deoxyribonuclease domain-containing protein [Chitinimonas taiwanensis]|uniref:Deoxyribonuclease NucA/NucB n=1 Tax=Chitinimonas taiwanensis DSM 18899 TaxID=1121279 RepID=A0A1K2HQR7_9NEIS|nr:NucA/NucB deoxyribonuclease domain-containing protein [Chitinimonas taiwanensis]SFZ79094.1 Deoxyribonuclease NucA/NucB [Chitinimonas taiwanensis DSM 18899]
MFIKPSWLIAGLLLGSLSLSTQAFDARWYAPGKPAQASKPTPKLAANRVKRSSESGPIDASDVAAVCARTFIGKTPEVLRSRTSFCSKTAPFLFNVMDKDGHYLGEVSVETYTYSDNNPTNTLSWPIKYRIRTTVTDGNPGQIFVKPEVNCPDCTITLNAGALLSLNGLSAEQTVIINFPRPAAGERLDFDTEWKYQFRGKGELENKPNESYVPKVRCDSGMAKKDSTGCVYYEAAAVFRSLALSNPDVDESARHIKDAQENGQPGQFVPKSPGSALADKDAVKPLSRQRGQSAIRASRESTKKACVARKNNPIQGECGSGDTDEPAGKGCDCDEYPFASSREGGQDDDGSGASIRIISPDDNRRAGGLLGTFYLRERVIDNEPFFVEIQ